MMEKGNEYEMKIKLQDGETVDAKFLSYDEGQELHDKGAIQNLWAWLHIKHRRICQKN